MREHLDSFGPSEAVIDRAVDLGQYSVEDEVVELFLVAHVAVQRRGYHSETGGKGAHAQRVHTVSTDDGEGLGDDVFAGKRAATVLFAGGRDGQFVALDAKDGKLLWETNLGPSVSAGPMTYAVNGKQYVSVQAGNNLYTFTLR